MSENINKVVTENEKEISASSILREIANIQKDNSHIFDALKQLESVKSEGPGDIGAEEKAKAIANVVKCRETTNQRLIDFYEKAYFDCITKENANRQEKIRSRIFGFLIWTKHPMSLTRMDELKLSIMFSLNSVCLP